METKDFNELKGNPKNPRTMSKHDAESLKRSITEFGDLSGIVFNKTTGRLVGGHQRVETFKRLGGQKKVTITQRFDAPNRVGTIAVGYLTYESEFYGYREVEWPEDREIAANIAANRISGEWDLDLLAEYDLWLKENNPDLLELTGQRPDEIDQLLGNVAPTPEKESDDSRAHLSFKLTEGQYATVERALQTMKATKNLQDEQNADLDGNALYYICRTFLAVDPTDKAAGSETTLE